MSWDVQALYDILNLDFQKAFDKVLHYRLLFKLQAHGIAEHPCVWIGHWLSNHHQSVVLNGEVSDR